MTTLTQASLEATLTEIQKLMVERGEAITIKPTKFIYRPSDLVELGFTVDDAIRLIEEKNT